MRTSTVVFLVLFLCLFSSHERRSKVRSVFEQFKAGIHSVTAGAVGHGSSRCDGSRSAENEEVSRLRSGLRELGRRDQAAKKTLRTIDRSTRALEDRIRKLERELQRQPQFADIFQRSLELLVRQRIDLDNERQEIMSLKERMAGESIRIQAEIDLAQIRGERREVEAFLRRERASPMDRLAEQQDSTSF